MSICLQTGSVGSVVNYVHDGSDLFALMLIAGDEVH